MKNLKQITSFLHVAELASFKLAAKKSFVSTTAISKQVQALESQLNEQLFIRSTRRVELTEFGEQFYQLCKKLEKNMEEIDEFVQTRKAEPQGKLTVQVQNSIARKMVLKRLNEFYQKFPKIELTLVFSDAEVSLEKENIDIMIGYTQLPGLTDNLKFRKIFHTKHVLCASPQFIERYGEPKSPKDLVNFKFITHVLRKPPNILQLADNSQYLTGPIVATMNSIEALNEACCYGIGISLTADSMVEDMIKDHRLVKLLPSLPYREFEIYIFYRAMNYEQASIRAFVDFYSDY